MRHNSAEVHWTTRQQLDISLVRCAHSWAIELNTRREIPYLREPMYYSLYLQADVTFHLLGLSDENILQVFFHFSIFPSEFNVKLYIINECRVLHSSFVMHV